MIGINYYVPTLVTCLMHLLGRNKLLPLRSKSAELDRWVCAWCAEITGAGWRGMNELLKDFPNASERSGFVVFPATRQQGFIVVAMQFSRQIALVSSVENS